MAPSCIGNSPIVRHRTSFARRLDEEIEKLGGAFNAHIHIDRAETLSETLNLLGLNDSSGLSSLSLATKHGIIPTVHASTAYDPDCLEQRVRECVQLLSELGTTKAHSVVDVTNDRVKTTALERLLKIGREMRHVIDFRVGAYSPLGFRDDEPARWDLLEKAVELADFIGALPERDDKSDYPEHIGFEQSCRRFLELTKRTGKPLHMHVDQKNHDRECGSEIVLRLSRELNIAKDCNNEPLIWLIHAISPSTYDEARFDALAQGLSEENIGVICCPSGALSMRQIRPKLSPTSNSIARVLEFLAAGVHVRLGTDNICDITSPAGTLDIRDELFVLTHALRFFDIGVLAKLASGHRLNLDEVERVRSHLIEDRIEVEKAFDAYNELPGR